MTGNPCLYQNWTFLQYDFRLSPLSTNGGEECTICFKEESSFPELSIKCSTHQRHNVCKQCLYTYFKQEIDEGQIVITINLSSKFFQVVYRNVCIVQKLYSHQIFSQQWIRKLKYSRSQLVMKYYSGHIKKSMIKYRFGSIYYRSQMHVFVRGLTVNSPLLPLNSPHAQKFNVKSVKQTFAIIVAKYGTQTNHVTSSGLLRNVQKLFKVCRPPENIY